MQERMVNVSREMEILRKKSRRNIRVKKNTIAFAGFMNDWPQPRKGSLSLKT